jgi:hypothetical protein
LSRKTRTLSDGAAVERPRVVEEVDNVGDVKGEAREAAKEEEREEKAAAAEEDGEAHDVAATGRSRRRPRRMIWRVSIASLSRRSSSSSAFSFSKIGYGDPGS